MQCALFVAVVGVVLSLSSAAARADTGDKPRLSDTGRKALLTETATLNLENVDWLLWGFEQDGAKRDDWDALKNWLAYRQSTTTAEMRRSLSEIAPLEIDFSKLTVKCYRDLLCTQVEYATKAVAKFDAAERLRSAVAEAEPVARGYMAAVDLTQSLDPVQIRDTTTLSEKFISRSFRDQLLLKRQRLSKRLSPEGVIVLKMLLDIADAQLQYENAAFVETDIMKGEWPAQSTLGDRGSLHAWLLVQHADHAPNLQVRVLASMQKLLDKNEVNRANYAYLYDRVHINAGRPQLYGSQFHCVNGNLEPENLEQPDDVDARRKAMGMQPLADYLRASNAGRCSN